MGWLIGEISNCLVSFAKELYFDRAPLQERAILIGLFCNRHQTI